MIPRYSELLAAKSTLLELKMHVVAAQIQAILRRYRPDQPRVPAGQPTGGRWTDGLAAGERIHVAGKYDPSR